MRNIQARFKEQELKHPYHGAFINLMKAVIGQGFKRDALIIAFRKLMPSEEYKESEMFDLINNLDSVTKQPEDSQKQGKNVLGASRNRKVN
jgi:hypothetical protein